MRINPKILVISSLVFGLLVVLSGIVLAFVIYPSFLNLEADLARRNLDRVQALLTAELEALARSNEDWAKRDETVGFISGSIGSDMMRRVSPAVLQNLNTDMMLIVDAEGEIIDGIYYAETGTTLLIPIPQSIIDAVTPVVAHVLRGEEQFGFVRTPRGPVLITARTVLPSDRSGAVRGVLLFGRIFDEAVIGAYSRRLELPFDLRQVDAPLDSGSAPQPIVRTNNAITATRILSDIDNQPGLLLSVTTDREIAGLGRHSVVFALGALTLAALAALAAMWLLLRRHVVRPLIGLTDRVLGVKVGGPLTGGTRGSGDLEARSDEIGVLAREMNLMLHQLDDLVTRTDEARQVAETANEAKSQFLTIMTLELRTPLNSIIGFSEIIANEQAELTPAAYRDYGGDILRSGRQLLTLINDLLDLAKAQAGVFQITEDVVDIADLIRRCVRTNEPMARVSGLRVVTEITHNFPMIRADGTRLRQIILNLLSNATKFTPPGGSVVIRARIVDGRGIVVQVEDSGIGIDQGDIERILHPMKHVENDMARRYSGTGLGLAIAKRLTESHGGTLLIDSDLGKGTRVSIYLPMSRVVRNESGTSVERPMLNGA